MKLKIISTVMIIGTGTHFSRISLSNCLKNGQNHKIMDDTIIEKLFITNQLAMSSVLVILFKEN